MGTAVGMMRVGNGVGSEDLWKVWGPTKLKRKLSTITMLKTAVMILAPRLLRFWRVLYLDRLNLSSHFVDVATLYHAIPVPTISRQPKRALSSPEADA